MNKGYFWYKVMDWAMHWQMVHTSRFIRIASILARTSDVCGTAPDWPTSDSQTLCISDLNNLQ